MGLRFRSRNVDKPSVTPPVYASWANNTNPVWYRDPGLRKNCMYILFLYLGTFVTGYDASYLNGLQSMPRWLNYFGNPTGSKLGLINASNISSALYLTTFYVGSIASSWITFGTITSGWESDWAWRLPTLLQGVGPAILFICAIFIPESPRWLVAQGREVEAKAILSRLHANGAENDELVDNEMEEITNAITREKEAGAGWKTLLSTPGNRKCLVVILVIATGTQWNGIGIISYYLAPVLRLVGVTNPTEIAGINGGLAVFNLFIAMGAATLVERIGRRPLWIVSTAGMLVGYIVMTGVSGGFASSGDKSTGLAVIPMLFIVYAFYDIAWSPLSYSYPVEILPFSIRAKGMTVFVWTQQMALAFNQWVNPVALKAISWKYYLVYVGMLFVYLVLILWLFVETRGYTMEEVSLLFDRPSGDMAEKK